MTEALGLSGNSSYLQSEHPASLYLALDGRLTRFPDRDVALLWDEERGWAAAVETHSGADLIVVAYLGHHVLPPPALVAGWVARLFQGISVGSIRPVRLRSADADDDLAGQLIAFGRTGLTSTTRSA
ncbi:DUF6292 family protein [Actinokineospora xionganensis]|uniref:DUF6292 domain-containing protein n=1 Tax=Actinokineospora xionganensis TaxID=2684470 RepID=A0ABR7L012_9PSEU|nr:DUF6292 family protein [Actinokineospora xionganensis]MBC6445701.1 hypothetical protein [Actinokineospora xionganensis]